jgi:hypothetical protein
VALLPTFWNMMSSRMVASGLDGYTNVCACPCSMAASTCATAPSGQKASAAHSWQWAADMPPCLYDPGGHS